MVIFTSKRPIYYDIIVRILTNIIIILDEIVSREKDNSVGEMAYSVVAFRSKPEEILETTGITEPIAY
jgi:hypothetical protein